MRTRTIALAALLALVAGACSLANDEPSSPSSAAISDGHPDRTQWGNRRDREHRCIRRSAERLHPSRRRGPHRRRSRGTGDRGLRLPAGVRHDREGPGPGDP